LLQAFPSHELLAFLVALALRSWLRTTIDNLNTISDVDRWMDDRSIAVEVDPTYEKFYNDYLIPNVPVILTPSFVESWSLFSSWFDNEHTINYQYLKERYGHLKYPIDDNKTGTVKEYILNDLFSIWEANSGHSLYLKDWHLPLHLLQSHQNVEKELYQVSMLL
jgi:hypothetical protein